MSYTLHTLAEWLRYSAFGMTGPAQDRSAVRGIAIHYNGGNADLDGPDNIFQDEDYARVLARMNDQYWRDPDRGYALGYNWGIGPDGDMWPIRGLNIRCAANGCQANNVPWVAIQCTTRFIEAPPTAAQLDALKNRWIPWLRTQYPNALTIVGHRDIKPICGGGTECPGPQLYPLVQQGFFNSPAPLPPPAQEDDEMDWFVQDGASQWWVGTQTKRKLNPAHTAGNAFQRSLAALAGVFIDVASGNATQQATYRQWVASVPDGDFTADDGVLTQILARVNLLAPDAHLEEVEGLVRAIPTSAPPGSGATTAEVKALLKAQKITLDLSAESATVDVP